MILRRFTQHIKEQNWFAVGLDVIVVVVGIFLGMQVTEWNEERQRQELSEAITERLINDLLYEAFNYEYLVEYYDDVQSNINRVISDLENQNQQSDIDFLVSAYRSTQYLIYYRRTTTFDEITANGQIDLIKDPLVKSTAEYAYNFDLMSNIGDFGTGSEYRRRFRMLIPIWIQEELLKNCGDKVVPDYDYEAIINSLDYPCSIEVPPEEIKKYVTILKTDPELLGLLRLQHSNIQTAITNLTFYFPDIRVNLGAVRKKFKIFQER